MLQKGGTHRFALLSNTLLLLCLCFFSNDSHAAGLNPRLIGTWPGFERGPAYAIALRGNYAYVAAQDAGLIVLDATDPAAPIRVGGIPDIGSTSDIALLDDHAFVAAGITGLVVIRITDPRSPTVIASLARDRVICSFDCNDLKTFKHGPTLPRSSSPIPQPQFAIRLPPQIAPFIEPFPNSRE